MQRKKGWYSVFFLSLILFSFIGQKIVYCEDVVPLPKELVILSTLNQIQEMQDKEEAVSQAFLEAQERYPSKSTSTQTPEYKKGGFWKHLSRNMHSYVSHTLGFRDNVFETKDKTSDFLNTLNFGVQSNLRAPSYNINLDAHIDFQSYLKNVQSEFYAMGVDLNINREIFYNSWFLSERFRSDLISEASELGGSERKFVRSQRNEISTGLKKVFNRFGYDVRYSSSLTSYGSAYSDRDFSENNFSFAETFRIAPKTSLMLEYEFGLIRYAQRTASLRDSDYWGVNLGALGVFTGKLAGILKWGYRQQEYNSGQELNDLTISGNLNYDLGEVTSLNLLLERKTHESSFGGEDYFINNQFTLGGVHSFSFNRKLSSNFSLGLQYQSFPRSTVARRQDELFGLSMELSYDFREWLRFAFGYQYRSRKSNVVYNYDSNVFDFKTRARF